MTPPPSLEAISQLTVRNVAHMVGFFVLAIIGAVTSILELLLSLHKYAVTMQSALKTVLGLCNAILQAAYVLEKLVQLHRTFVTAREPQETPASYVLDHEDHSAVPPHSQDSPTTRIPMTRSATRAALTLRLSSSSISDTASITSYHSVASLPHHEL